MLKIKDKELLEKLFEKEKESCKENGFDEDINTIYIDLSNEVDDMYLEIDKNGNIYPSFDDIYDWIIQGKIVKK